MPSQSADLYISSASETSSDVAPKLNYHGRAALAADANVLREHLGDYFPRVKLPNGQRIKRLKPEEWKVKNSPHVGFSSSCTTRLLCPISKRDAFDACADDDAREE